MDVMMIIKLVNVSSWYYLLFRMMFDGRMEEEVKYVIWKFKKKVCSYGRLVKSIILGYLLMNHE